jgi:hypothetical protein
VVGTDFKEHGLLTYIDGRRRLGLSVAAATVLLSGTLY